MNSKQGSQFFHLAALFYYFDVCYVMIIWVS